jgi:hypothetical protein
VSPVPKDRPAPPADSVIRARLERLGLPDPKARKVTLVSRGQPARPASAAKPDHKDLPARQARPDLRAQKAKPRPRLHSVW